MSSNDTSNAEKVASISERVSQKLSAEKMQLRQQLLIEHISKELESYFVPGNLAEDVQLRKKMNAEGYVDLAYLMTLPLIRPLAKSVEILIHAVKKSDILALGYGQGGKPMAKYSSPVERKTLILRDMPIGITEHDVAQIFEDPNCAKPTRIQCQVGNNWFVSFNTEKESISTAQYLQQRGTIQGKPLHVRVKAYNPIQQSSGPGGYNSTKYYGHPSAYFEQQQQRHYDSITGAYHRSQSYYTNGVNYVYNKDKYSSSLEPQLATSQLTDGADETAASSEGNYCNYVGHYEKYDYQTFIDIFNSMRVDQLIVPQSMRGRDARVISESVLQPSIYTPLPKKKEQTGKRNQGRGRGRGRGRGQNRGRGGRGGRGRGQSRGGRGRGRGRGRAQNRGQDVREHEREHEHGRGRSRGRAQGRARTRDDKPRAKKRYLKPGVYYDSNLNQMPAPMQDFFYDYDGHTKRFDNSYYDDYPDRYEYRPDGYDAYQQPTSGRERRQQYQARQSYLPGQYPSQDSRRRNNKKWNQAHEEQEAEKKEYESPHWTQRYYHVNSGDVYQRRQ